MPDYGASPDFEIASLKKKSAHGRDLMMPGNGIPWEDRGVQGMIGAFFSTCVRSMTRHTLLLDHIRRPETTHEARLFAIMCGVLWSLGWLVWRGSWYFYYNAHLDRYGVDGMQYVLETAVQAVLIAVLVFVLLRISVAVYGKLIAGVVRTNSVPPSLVYNVMAYSMGPSLLAIIPVVGWIAAAVWIFFDIIIAGSSRLYLKTREAVVNAILVSFLAILIGLAAWAGWWLLWGKIMSSNDSVELRDLTPPTRLTPMSPMRPMLPSPRT